MRYKVAIDLGMIRIKVLAAEIQQQKIANVKSFAFNYANSVSQNKPPIVTFNESCFFDNLTALQDQLLKIKDKFEEDTEFMVSISTFPGQIFFKKINAKNKKRLKAAIKFFENSFRQDGYENKHSIVSYDKISKEAKVLFYKYDDNYVRSIFDLFKDNQMQLVTSEFDIINMMNIIDKSFYESQDAVVVDFGFSKTNFFVIRNGEISDYGSSSLALGTSIIRLARHKKDTVINAINQLVSKNLQEYSSTDYDVFFKPLLTGVKKEIDSLRIPRDIDVKICGGVVNQAEFFELISKYFDGKVSLFNPFEEIFPLSSNRYSNSIFANCCGLLVR